MWCIQAIDAEYRERMYDIIDLYEEPYDPKKASRLFWRENEATSWR
jgi:hypothetical protein